MEAQQNAVSKKELYQSNELTSASYYLPIQAKRVIWLCLSQISFGKKLEDGQFRVQVSDYMSLFGVSQATASRDLQAAAKTLLTNFVSFPDDTGEMDFVSRPWLEEAGQRTARGVWRFSFNNKILPYISGLSEQFTLLRLHECHRLTKPRTIRLYECLCQWAESGNFVTSPEWLAERFVLPESQKKNFAEMKRRFINPAMDEINDRTSLTVSMLEDKDGATGKVKRLLFTIEAPGRIQPPPVLT